MPVRPQVASGESLNRFVCQAWVVTRRLAYLKMKFRFIIRGLLRFLTRVKHPTIRPKIYWSSDGVVK